jgi:hypothetical protein
LKIKFNNENFSNFEHIAKSRAGHLTIERLRKQEVGYGLVLDEAICLQFENLILVLEVLDLLFLHRSKRPIRRKRQNRIDGCTKSRKKRPL